MTGVYTLCVCKTRDKMFADVYLSVLEDKEPHVLSVVNLVLSEDGGREILNPDPRQLVPVDIVVLEISLQISKVEIIQ